MTVVRGILVGVVVAAVGVGAWYLANEVGEVLAAAVAVLLGIGVGVGLVAGAGGRGGWLLALVGVVLIVLANAVGQNFVQRDGLQDGVDALQEDWSDLQVESVAISEDLQGDLDDPVDTTPEGELSCDLVPEGVTIPPPEILAVLPVEALSCFEIEDLAVVWEDIPLEKREQVPAEIRREVRDVLSADAEEETKERLEAKRQEYEETVYDIPDEVVACAPQPDFTQPDAESGLGFPDGIPVFLPAADLFSEERERGDGLDNDPASPGCFLRERAESHPLEAASWVVAAAAAFAIPLRKRRPT